MESPISIVFFVLFYYFFFSNKTCFFYCLFVLFLLCYVSQLRPNVSTQRLKTISSFQDFSSKGGPKDAVAKFDGDGIVFPDLWLNVSRGTSPRKKGEILLL